MNSPAPGLILPLALLLPAAIGAGWAGEATRPAATLAQAAGAAPPAGEAAPGQGQGGVPGATACPPGTDKNVCAVLAQPLPPSAPRGGGVSLQRTVRPGLSNQESLRGMSVGR